MNDSFSISKNAWYTQRDDRTCRVVDNAEQQMSEFSMGVIISENACTDYSVYAMTIVALNILSRWCRKITIDAPEGKCMEDADRRSLHQRLMDMMSNNDPHGDFSLGKVDGNSHKTILIIGPQSASNTFDHHWINGNGWLAGFGYGRCKYRIDGEASENVIGTVFAATVGVSELFKVAINGRPFRAFSKWYSLFDFAEAESPLHLSNPFLPTDLRFGTIHQVGCGAVGSSFLSILGLTKWKGTLHIVDFDFVNLSNCSSSLAFNAFDAAVKNSKVDVATRVMKDTSFRVSTYPMAYDEFISHGHYEAYPPDLILCLANERNIWSTIQNNYPPIVYHATTTASWGVNFGRHIPIREWCLMCRFQNELQTKFQPPCGDAVLFTEPNNQSEILGTLPFLSPTSAILILAEMAKLAMNTVDFQNNFHEFSLKPTGCGSFLSHFRAPSSLCKTCQEQSRDIYIKCASESRYWEFSNFRHRHSGSTIR